MAEFRKKKKKENQDEEVDVKDQNNKEQEKPRSPRNEWRHRERISQKPSRGGGANGRYGH